MAYDPTMGVVILFGGWNGTDVFNDTWEYKAGAWTELHPAHAPGPVWGASMVWDPTDGYLLLFGGWNFTNGNSNLTWKFENGDWALLHPVVSPTARDIAGMTWDAGDGTILLFGGTGPSRWLNDTWTYLGGNWTQILIHHTPEWRGGSSMAYDPTDGYVILTWGEAQQEYQDLWTYHAGAWTNRTAAAGGSAAIATHRDGAVLVWDPAAGYALGSLGESLGLYPNDTCSVVGGLFTNLYSPVAPLGVQYAAATWDAADGYVLIFGGAAGTRLQNTTWAWSTPLPLVPLGSVSPPPADVGQTVFYQGWARGGDPPYAFSWEFGDGQTGAGAHAQHAYNWPGTYQINLTVEDNDSEYANQSFTMTVVWGPGGGALTAAASCTPDPATGSIPLEVSCKGRGSGGFPPYTPVWTMGDGTVFDGWNITHNYTNAGTYDAVLTIRDRSGQTNETTTLVDATPYVPPPPPIAIVAEASPASGKAPLTVQFTSLVTGGVAPYTYDWTFGDGGSSGLANTTYVYSSAGPAPSYQWTVVLRVTDAQQVSAQKTLTVTIYGSNSTATSAPGFLGLPGDEGVILVAALVVVVVVITVLAVVVVRRRPPPSEEEAPYSALQVGAFPRDPPTPPPPALPPSYPE